MMVEQIVTAVLSVVLTTAMSGIGWMITRVLRRMEIQEHTLAQLEHRLSAHMATEEAQTARTEEQISAILSRIAGIEKGVDRVNERLDAAILQGRSWHG